MVGPCTRRWVTGNDGPRTVSAAATGGCSGRTATVARAGDGPLSLSPVSDPPNADVTTVAPTAAHSTAHETCQPNAEPLTRVYSRGACARARMHARTHARRPRFSVPARARGTLHCARSGVSGHRSGRLPAGTNAVASGCAVYCALQPWQLFHSVRTSSSLPMAAAKRGSKGSRQRSEDHRPKCTARLGRGKGEGGRGRLTRRWQACNAVDTSAWIWRTVVCPMGSMRACPPTAPSVRCYRSAARERSGRTCQRPYQRMQRSGGVGVQVRLRDESKKPRASGLPPKPPSGRSPPVPTSKRSTEPPTNKRKQEPVAAALKLKLPSTGPAEDEEPEDWGIYLIIHMHVVITIL